MAIKRFLSHLAAQGVTFACMSFKTALAGKSGIRPSLSICPSNPHTINYRRSGSPKTRASAEVDPGLGTG